MLTPPRSGCHSAPVSVAAALAVLALATLPIESQTSEYRAPRTADGRPDLNGIWQALNTANYDLETHMARPAMALREGPHGPLPSPEVLTLGAVGAVPGGLGVVEGGAIPYKAEALAKKRGEPGELADAGPGDPLLSSRRPPRDVHAVPVPDLSERERHPH